jgi:hypothetical protein
MLWALKTVSHAKQIGSSLFYLFMAQRTLEKGTEKCGVVGEGLLI